jgi:hypothetical protein
VDASETEAKEYQGEPLDALEELLAYDSNQQFTEVLDMEKYGFKTKWVIQNLVGEQHTQLVERASKIVKNTGSGTLQKQLDGPRFQALAMAFGVKSPNLRDPKLYAKYGLRPNAGLEDRLVREMFRNRPGLVNYVSNAVLDLTGFSEDLVEVAKSPD